MNEQGKLNILQVHNFYQQAGGEDTVAANEKKLLEDAGHSVFTYYRSNEELKRIKGIRKLAIPFTAVFSFRTYREMKKIIKENGIDLVHIHNTHMMISPSAFYAAFHCHVPVVQTIHNFRLACPAGVFYRDGQICEDCLQNGLECAVRHSCYRGSKALTLVNAAVTKIHRILGTYRKAYFICLTEFNRDKLLELNKKGKQILDEQKIFIKPNFTFKDEKKEQNSTSDTILRSEKSFLFVGRLEPMKGIERVISAFEQMPEFELNIAGTGPLTGQSRANIHFLGQLSKERLGWYYKTSTALVMASQWYEGFPMVIAEAYSYGLPVIAGDIGNLSSLVKDGVTGVLYPYNSVESLVQAVASMQQRNMGEMEKNAAAFYEQELSSEGNLAILEQIYKEILEKYH